MRLGIFGGTFDPPHVGHLIVAADAMSALNLDRILFVPAGTHPLKRARVEAPAESRLAMIEAALGDSASFVVDEREIHRSGPSYTVDTVIDLESEHPGAELFLLVGSDVLDEIHNWHRVAEIAVRARIAVLSRVGAGPVTRPESDLVYDTVEVTHVAISSTEVRERVREGRPFRYLVPEPVYRIILDHALYRDSAKG
jgi:nicotinate-nucleotide adenylyltransferase